MTAGRAAVVAGLLVVVAGAAAWRAVVPAPVTAADVRSRLRGRAAIEHGSTHPGLDAAWYQRVALAAVRAGLGAPVERRLGGHLVMADTTLVDVLGRMVAAFVIGSLVLVSTFAALVGAGVVGGSVWWLVVVLAVPVLMAWRQVVAVIESAARRRRELHRAITDFTQLVSVALTTNRSVEEAVRFAVDTGDGFGFDLLRRAVVSAPVRGVPVWDALDELAERCDLDDLRNVAASLHQQAELGSSSAETIRAEARSMRAKQLNVVVAEADRANQNLALPSIGMVLGMVLFLLYPVMVSVSEAFAP